MKYILIARIKGLFRWLAFELGTTTFSAYSDVTRESSKYDGWYEWRGRVIAFRRSQEGIQSVW